MSVIVTNITEHRGGVYGRGMQTYVLRINRKVIAEFTHHYADGLAECLRKAAAAAEDPERREIKEREAEIAALTYGLDALRRTG